jgi:sec-independent protein translocase protein TatA
VSLLFFDFGSGEIFLIVLVIFLIFGPDKIPEMARSLGKFINEVKRASEDIKTEINKEADKKEREKKLKEFREKVKAEGPVSNALPRSSTPHIEKLSDSKENLNISKAEDETGEKKRK